MTIRFPSGGLAAVRDRSFLIVVACYVVARLLLIAEVEPTSNNDTVSYQSIDLLGRAGRPWVLPVVFRLTTDHAFVVLQTVISALSIVALAVAIGSQLHDQRVRVGLMGGLLLLGLSPRVTSWDGALITESQVS